MRNPLDLGLTLSDRFSRCDHRSYKAATEVVRVLPSVPVKLDLLPGGHLFDVDITMEDEWVSGKRLAKMLLVIRIDFNGIFPQSIQSFAD